MAIPEYTVPAAIDNGTAAPRWAPQNDGARPAPGHLAERWTEWLRAHDRLAQASVDLATIAIVGLTFATTLLPAEVMFHVVFVLLTVHAFLFGLRGTLLRIGIVTLPLLVYANASVFGLKEPAFDLAEWPLMFVIAVLVALMADRRDATARRYAGLFREASERLMTVEEDERRRIALELHDGVGQVLTAMTLTLDAAEGEATPAAAREHVGAARSMAGTALAEVRHLAHRMRPARLEERGLVAAIRDLVGQSGFPVDVQVDTDSTALATLPPTVTVGAFRIVQEALANAGRHSGADMARVRIGTRDGRLVVVVSDDGRGFDAAAARESGIGLAGMAERMALIGGRLAIDSAPGRGTSVTLDIPVRAATD